MKILVCGQRDYTNQAKILNVLQKYPKDTIIIHGAANGADTLAGGAADFLGFKVLSFPAHWKHTDKCKPECNEYVGKGAGPIRNKKMLDEGKPDLIIAFYNDKSLSIGTNNMVSQAIKAGIEVLEYIEN